MKNIIYKPWIGEKYNKSELGKLLILGDSHYFLDDEDEKDYPDFTNKIIKDLKNCNYPFYRKIGKFFNEENILEIWDKVAFANAIQVPFRDAKQKPTDEDLETVENAVKEYLKLTNPDKLIVFSSRVWNQGLPPSINWINKVDEIQDKEFNVTLNVYKFAYSKNKFCYGTGLYHPSYPKFKMNDYKNVIKKFIDKEFK